MNPLRIVILLTMSALLISSYCYAQDTDKANIDDKIIDESSKAFDPQEIAKRVGAITLDIQRCYGEVQKKKKDLAEGEIKIRFTITEEGKTKEVSIRRSEVKNTKVEKCIKDLITELNFPPSPEGEITVNYPFIFNNPDLEKGKKSEGNKSK